MREHGKLSRRSMLTVGALAGAAPIIAASNKVAAASEEPEPIVVGTAAALTGWGAADGIDFKLGAELAVEDINALGGICGRKLVHVAEDAREMGPQNNIAATRALIDRHGVKAIINGYLVGGGPEY